MQSRCSRSPWRCRELTPLPLRGGGPGRGGGAPLFEPRFPAFPRCMGFCVPFSVSAARHRLGRLGATGGRGRCLSIRFPRCKGFCVPFPVHCRSTPAGAARRDRRAVEGKASNADEERCTQSTQMVRGGGSDRDPTRKNPRESVSIILHLRSNPCAPPFGAHRGSPRPIAAWSGRPHRRARTLSVEPFPSLYGVLCRKRAGAHLAAAFVVPPAARRCRSAIAVALARMADWRWASL